MAGVRRALRCATRGPSCRWGDTLFCPFSVTKAITATLLHIQAERGLVEYEAPVAKYWPEFAANGKEATTVRDALSHRAGIPQMPDGCTPEQMCDWEWMVTHVAELAPLFPPGTTNGYHSLVWGWLIGEIVRRTDPKGRSFSQFAREELFEPIGVTDVYYGLPDSEFDRYAPVLMDGTPAPDPDPFRGLSMPLAVHPSAPVHNRRDVMQAAIPGAGAIVTARDCARVFALLANGGELNGVRLLGRERLLDCTEPRPDPDLPDQVLHTPAWVGVGGYWLGGEAPAANPLTGGVGTHILCHPGAGGSFAWADLDTGLAVAICHNRMHGTWAASNPFMPIAEAIRAVAAEQLAVSSSR